MLASGFRRGALVAARRWKLWNAIDGSRASISVVPLPAFSGGAASNGCGDAARGFSIQARVKDEEADDFSGLCKLVDSEYNVVGAVSKWIDEGNVLSSETLLRLVTWMSQKRMYVQAFKLLACVREKRLAKYTPQLFAIEMELTSRQFKSSRVEALYNLIPEEMRTTDVSRALLSCLISHKHLGKVEKFLEEVKVLDTEGWNIVLDMYLRRDKHKKVVANLAKMKEAGVEPNARTYRILLACKDVIGGFEGIVEDAGEHLSKVDATSAQVEVLEEMLEAYGYLGKLDAVDRTWSILKQKEDVPKSSYLIAMKAFGMARDVPKAEKVFQELLAITSTFTSRKHNPYAAMIEVYANAGLMDEAEKLLKEKGDEELKGNFWPYEYLILGYLSKDDAASALGKLNGGLEAVKKGSTRLEYKSVMGLLAALALRRDVGEAEKVMGHYSAFFGEAEIYNQLLKVYIAAGRNPGDFKERMRQRFIDPDEETDRLLERKAVEEEV